MLKKFLLQLKKSLRRMLELLELAFFMRLQVKGRADEKVIVIQNSHLGDFVLSVHSHPITFL